MLDKSNPFVIKVPEGASEIDLGPILRPLIFQLLKGGRLADPENIETFILDWDMHLAYRELIPKISRAVLVDYLKANDWEPEDEREYCFRRFWDMKRPSYDRCGPRVWTNPDPQNWSLSRLDEAIKVLVQEERNGSTKLSIARKILANANILDRIVGEL